MNEHKTSKNKFPSVCPAVLFVLFVRMQWLYVRTWILVVDTITFEKRIQTKFGGCLLRMKCRSGIEIQNFFSTFFSKLLFLT